MSSALRAAVYVTPSIPFILPGPPTATPPIWSPTTATLISGDREAVLVDTLFTTTQVTALADWIERTIPGKKLTKVYITHGHGDHFFGLALLKKRFPGLRAFAFPSVIAHMKQQLEPKTFQRSWENLFPGMIKPNGELAEELGSDGIIDLEGHVLRAVEVGQSDTHVTTFLHVPDLKLVVAGDIVYNDVHPFLAEANTVEKRRGWIASLRRIEQLRPEIIIAGHKRDGAVDSVGNLYETIQYIETFERLLRESKDANHLFSQMLVRYPTYINPQALRASAKVGWAKRTTSKI